jgi:membrane-associated PAP2 superfamily phosphatase
VLHWTIPNTAIELGGGETQLVLLAVGIAAPPLHSAHVEPRVAACFPAAHASQGYGDVIMGFVPIGHLQSRAKVFSVDDVNLPVAHWRHVVLLAGA